MARVLLVVEDLSVTERHGKRNRLRCRLQNNDGLVEGASHPRFPGNPVLCVLDAPAGHRCREDDEYCLRAMNVISNPCPCRDLGFLELEPVTPQWRAGKQPMKEVDSRVVLAV